MWLYYCLRWGEVRWGEELWEISTSAPPGPLAGSRRRPWRVTGRVTGRTAVHRLSDDIHSALFGGLVHPYLYMLNVCNDSLGVTAARYRARCIAHATSFSPLSGVHTTWSQVTEWRPWEVRLVAQGHMVSRAGIWTELFLTPKPMLVASIPFSLSWSTYPLGAIAHSKAWVRLLRV